MRYTLYRVKIYIVLHYIYIAQCVQYAYSDAAGCVLLMASFCSLVSVLKNTRMLSGHMTLCCMEMEFFPSDLVASLLFQHLLFQLYILADKIKRRAMLKCQNR